MIYLAWQMSDDRLFLDSQVKNVLHSPSLDCVQLNIMILLEDIHMHIWIYCTGQSGASYIGVPKQRQQ